MVLSCDRVSPSLSQSNLKREYSSNPHVDCGRRRCCPLISFGSCSEKMWANRERTAGPTHSLSHSLSPSIVILAKSLSHRFPPIAHSLTLVSPAACPPPASASSLFIFHLLLHLQFHETPSTLAIRSFGRRLTCIIRLKIFRLQLFRVFVPRSITALGLSDRCHCHIELVRGN